MWKHKFLTVCLRLRMLIARAAVIVVLTKSSLFVLLAEWLMERKDKQTSMLFQYPKKVKCKSKI